MSLGAGPYLILATALFGIGAVGLMVRRNVLIMVLCIELMLHAVALSFVTFSRRLDDVAGQSFTVILLFVAALEAVVGAALVMAMFRRRAGIGADDQHELQG